MLFRDKKHSFWAQKGVSSIEIAGQPLVETVESEPSITCPRCGRTSYNPNDIREGSCGHCHDWTKE